MRLSLIVFSVIVLIFISYMMSNYKVPGVAMRQSVRANAKINVRIPSPNTAVMDILLACGNQGENNGENPFVPPVLPLDLSVFSVGPGGGGACFDPSINPQDPDNFTVSCDMSSTFTTIDGGKSFRNHQFYDMTRYDYNPHDENIIYAYHRTQVYISHLVEFCYGESEYQFR